MALNLRGPEAAETLQHKNSLKADLLESDSVAVVQAGARTFTVPIYIQKGSGKSVVESDFTFNEARPNTYIEVDGEKALVVRFEKIPRPAVQPPAPPAEPSEEEIFEARLKAAREANPGASGWVLQKQIRAQMFQEGLARQQQATKQQQGIAISDRWRGFAEQAQRERNATFGQR